MNATSLLEYTQDGWLYLSWDWQRQAELRHNGLNYVLELPRTGVSLAVELELLPRGNNGTQVKILSVYGEEFGEWIANIHFHSQAHIDRQTALRAL